MKSILTTTIFLLLGLLCTCHGQSDVPFAKAGRSANGIVVTPLRFIIKERNLWNSRSGKRYINANFLYNRATNSREGLGICASSSYSLPLLYGYRLDRHLSFEGGIFGGLNRNRLAGTSILGPELGPAQNDLAYGLLGGFAYGLHEGVDVKLRYRYDFGDSFQAWNPVQVGLSFRF
ncbi:MAG: hypothetical protein AAF741_05510 [Bacteroidota bacterium]